MYLPFAEALNYALERVSNIRVNGLPEFQAHIAFVPCNKRVPSDRNLNGSLFKPDLAIVSLQDAREFYKFESPDAPELSQFVSEIAGDTPPGFTGWKAMLSAVEVKRGKDAAGWVLPKVFDYQDKQVSVVRDADQRLDEKAGDSQSTTRKVNALPWGYILKRVAQRFHR